MAVMTVDEARRYAASVSPQTDGGDGGVFLPPGGGGGSSGGSGGPSGGGGSTYVRSLDLSKLQALASAGLNPYASSDVEVAYALWKMNLGGMNELKILREAGLVSTSDISNQLFGDSANKQHVSVGGKLYTFDPVTGAFELAVDSKGNPIGDVGRSTFDTGPGYLDLANRNFDEQVRQFNQQFGLNQQTADRSEQAARAGTGLSLADLARGLSQDYYQLAKDPGNFPALAAAYSGLEGQAGQGSPLSTLLGEGFRIKPDAMSNPLGDQRFRDLLDQLYQRAGGMNADFGAVRDAYARDPQAAATFFAQKPEDLARMFGAQPMAAGGAFIANRPMRLQDLTTGDTTAVLGEQGKPEQVSVTPLQAMASTSSATPPEYSPAEATSVALGNSLKGLGYVPKNILDTLGSGQLLGPNMVPDWLLKRLPPSLIRLLQADVLSNLGSAGAGDYWAERQRYVPQGFNAFAGGVRR